MRYLIYIYSLFFSFLSVWAQTPPTSQTNSIDLESATISLSFKNYLDFVKTFHPVAKQADLQISKADTYLLKAKGGIDPKLEIDFNQKKFKDKSYYKILNSKFKIPTWYGVSFKAGFENNDGYYLDPSLTVPDNGLLATGVELDLGRGTLINPRIIALKQARIYQKETTQKQQLQISELLYKASTAYAEWFKNHQKYILIQKFIKNNKQRFIRIKQGYQAGQYAAIDTLEAFVNLQKNTLRLQDATLNVQKARLKTSNYLWISNELPLEIKATTAPEALSKVEIQSLYEEISLKQNLELNNHPKLKAFDFKIQGLNLQQRLHRNNLLPKINLSYSWIQELTKPYQNELNTNYKFGVGFYTSLFLRKERASLKLTKLKVQETQWEALDLKNTLKNKLTASKTQIKSYDDQWLLAGDMSTNFGRMLQAEKIKFEAGESSLFYVDVRESKFLEAQIKQNELLFKFWKAHAQYIKNCGSYL